MNRVSVIMGSISDWPTMKEAVAILEQFEVTVETHIISAHRMPTEMATLNKIDMPSAMPDEVEDEIIDLIGCKREDILRASGKTGEGNQHTTLHIPLWQCI